MRCPNCERLISLSQYIVTLNKKYFWNCDCGYLIPFEESGKERYCGELEEIALLKKTNRSPINYDDILDMHIALRDG